MGHHVEFINSKKVVQVDDINLAFNHERINVTAPEDVDQAYKHVNYLDIPVTLSGNGLSVVEDEAYEHIRSQTPFKVELRFDNGKRYKGDLSVDRVAQSSRKGNTQTPMQLIGVFAGSLDDLSSKDPTTQSTIIDIKRGTSYFPGSTFTKGYQDDRQTEAIRPFYIEGLTDANTNPKDALDVVVAAEGGNFHTHQSDATLGLLSGSARPIGRGQVTGWLRYGRGPRDCVPAHASYSVGWIDDIGTGLAAVSAGTNASVCDDLGISISPLVKRRSPIKHIQIPCVWPDHPLVALDTPSGTINNGDYTIEGITYPSFSLRWDGYDAQSYQSAGSAYWAGNIRITYKPNLWTSHQIICVRTVPLPLEGNQTVPGYTLEFGTVQVYQYSASKFPSIASVCPKCY